MRRAWEWMIKSFKNVHSSWTEIRCVMADKDLLERKIIKQQLPSANVLICVNTHVNTQKKIIRCAHLIDKLPAINSGLRLDRGTRPKNSFRKCCTPLVKSSTCISTKSAKNCRLPSWIISIRTGTTSGTNGRCQETSCKAIFSTQLTTASNHSTQRSKVLSSATAVQKNSSKVFSNWFRASTTNAITRQPIHIKRLRSSRFLQIARSTFIPNISRSTPSVFCERNFRRGSPRTSLWRKKGIVS